jgi:protein SCO1/2
MKSIYAISNHLFTLGIDNDDEISGMVYPLFISVDGKRDSVAAVKDYLRDFNPMILGLTGTEEQIKNMAKKYRVYYSPASVGSGDADDYLLDHTVYFYLMDPEGNFVDVYGRESTSSETYLKIYENIQKYVAKNGSSHIKKLSIPKAQTI